MISKRMILCGDLKLKIRIPQDFAKEHKTPPFYEFLIIFKQASGKYRDAWFIHLLTKSKPVYLGMLSLDGKVILTNASKFTMNSICVRILNRVLLHIWNDDFFQITFPVSVQSNSVVTDGSRLDEEM